MRKQTGNSEQNFKQSEKKNILVRKKYTLKIYIHCFSFYVISSLLISYSLCTPVCINKFTGSIIQQQQKQFDFVTSGEMRNLVSYQTKPIISIASVTIYYERMIKHNKEIINMLLDA